MLNTLAAYPSLSKQNHKAFLPHQKGYLSVPLWVPTSNAEMERITRM
jgi:hypothetical protein